MGNTELIQTNSTKNEYFDHQFGSGFTTILPKKIRKVEFVFHDVDVSGLVLCTILSRDNVKIIDREIIKNTKSYKLYKVNLIRSTDKNLYVIQPAGIKVFEKLIHISFA